MNPLLSPSGGLFITNPFEGGLIWEEGGGGGSYLILKTMVSVLHKDLEYKVDKLKYIRLEVMQPRIKNKSDLSVGK